MTAYEAYLPYEFPPSPGLTLLFRGVLSHAARWTVNWAWRSGRTVRSVQKRDSLVYLQLEGSGMHRSVFFNPGTACRKVEAPPPPILPIFSIVIFKSAHLKHRNLSIASNGIRVGFWVQRASDSACCSLHGMSGTLDCSRWTSFAGSALWISGQFLVG